MIEHLSWVDVVKPCIKFWRLQRPEATQCTEAHDTLKVTFNTESEAESEDEAFKEGVASEEWSFNSSKEKS